MSEKPLHRVYGYARVSTEDQDLSLQRAALIKAGCDPDFIYEEHGSGGTMERMALKRLMRSMRAGDKLVVWKLDRLGRTLTGVIEFVKELRDEGIDLEIVTEKIDTSTAAGRAFFQMTMVFAELERGLISERTKAGMEVARSRGARFGQPFAITKTEKRKAEAQRIVDEGLEFITAETALARINAADKSVPPIKSVATWGRWMKAGCPGLE